jgi:predicted Zn-dependent peptidase
VGLRRTVLPSGFTIFTRERPDTASVALQVAVRAGSRDEDDTTWGGSHWLEHAHFLGTQKRQDNQAIFGAIEEVGGDINASTSHELTDFYNVVPAENFDLGLDVLADQLLNSTFPAEAFDRERRVVFEELKRNFDTPSRRATDEFFRLVFQVSPLRRDAAGFVETVANIPIPTILAYREQHYFASNMAIAAIGNLRHDEAVAKIAAAFARLPRGPRTMRPRTPEPAETQPRRLEIGEGSRVAEVRLGWPVPGDDSEDSVAMEILQDVLGTTGRRLSEEIRDRRALATSVGVSNAVFSDAGALLITASTQPANVDQVVDLILAEIRRVRDGGVSAEDVAISKRARAGQRALSQELNAAQSGIADVEVSGTLDSYAEYLARLAPVTPADVQRVARTYLDPANYTIVVIRS